MYVVPLCYNHSRGFFDIFTQVEMAEEYEWNN